MIVETELLCDHVDDQRFFARWKLINALRPKGYGEPKKQHRFDQYDGEFQMRRDAAPDSQGVRPGLSPFPEPDQHKDKKRRPSHKQHAHEPVAKFQDMIDLISVRGGVRRLPEEFVNQSKATHICSDLPR